MRIFLYEQITATFEPSHPLYAEGAAMRDALHADLAAIEGVEMLAGHFDSCAARADWTLLIAPETGGVLLELAERVVRLGGRLLGPSPEAIRLAGDKLAMFERWQSFHVNTPHTRIASPTIGRFPLIVKPRDGAGSDRTARIENAKAYETFAGQHPEAMIVQSFIPGTPASIAFLVGPQHTLALRPTRQILDDRFHYLGGECPLPPELAERATALGRAALAAAGPGWLGYVGIDMVLGDEGDFAIEINPRPTTSYIGLREATEANLAELALRLAEGGAVPEIGWKPGPLRWNAR
jgi:predicted ATP-grasp superfamily ATP-dependent carboligase